MLRLPLRSEAKNTHWESIENAGAFELFSPRVSWMRFEPSECARYTCVFDSLFSPSITGRVSVHTASLPSGEGTAAVTVFTFIESSGVHCPQAQIARKKTGQQGFVFTGHRPPAAARSFL